MAGVDVYKNAASNLIEGGVGGVVNIRTRLPFDSKEDINVITLKSNYYDRIRKYSPAGSGLLSRQFKTDFGRMGFLVNATASKTYYRQDAVLQQQQHCLTATVGKCATDPTQAPAASKIAAYNSMPNKGSLSELYVPTSFEMYQDSGERKRQGLALAYQWQVNNDVLLTAQNLYSNYTFIRRGEYIYGDDKNSDPLQRLDGTHIGQLADIGCLDRVDDLVGILLEIARRLQRRALAGDDHGARGVRVPGCTRGAGILRMRRQRPCHQQRAGLRHNRFSNRFCISVSHSDISSSLFLGLAFVCCRLDTDHIPTPAGMSVNSIKDVLEGKDLDSGRRWRRYWRGTRVKEKIVFADREAGSATSSAACSCLHLVCCSHRVRAQARFTGANLCALPACYARWVRQGCRIQCYERRLITILCGICVEV
jgi:hypothetical protein